MDRSEAFRRLADVVNLTDGVEFARGVVDLTDDAIGLARRWVETAEANHAKAQEALDAALARREDAEALVAEIPQDLLALAAADLAGKRATRTAYLDALAAAGTGDHTQALAEVMAAAEAAGATIAHAAPAEVGSTGERTGS